MVEINTRKAGDREAREADLLETLAFSRFHFAADPVALGAETAAMASSPRGRRPGAPDTRAEILASARALFADRGFGRTTIRAVAADAGVDPALVHHYFGTKDDLFVAALQLPGRPAGALAPVIDGRADGAGRAPAPGLPRRVGRPEQPAAPARAGPRPARRRPASGCCATASCRSC